MFVARDQLCLTSLFGNNRNIPKAVCAGVFGYSTMHLSVVKWEAGVSGVGGHLARSRIRSRSLLASSAPAARGRRQEVSSRVARREQGKETARRPRRGRLLGTPSQLLAREGGRRQEQESRQTWQGKGGREVRMRGEERIRKSGWPGRVKGEGGCRRKNGVNRGRVKRSDKIMADEE